MSPDQMTALQSRLERLKKEISFLESNRPTDVEKLLADEFALHALERSLEVCLEAVLDIGRLLIALKNLPKPHTNAEIFDILGKNNILPQEFAKKIRSIGGMRNVLVHDYMELNYEKVYEALHNVADLKEFAQYIVKSLV